MSLEENRSIGVVSVVLQKHGSLLKGRGRRYCCHCQGRLQIVEMFGSEVIGFVDV